MTNTEYKVIDKILVITCAEDEFVVFANRSNEVVLLIDPNATYGRMIVQKGSRHDTIAPKGIV